MEGIYHKVHRKVHQKARQKVESRKTMVHESNEYFNYNFSITQLILIQVKQLILANHRNLEESTAFDSYVKGLRLWYECEVTTDLLCEVMVGPMLCVMYT